MQWELTVSPSFISLSTQLLTGGDSHPYELDRAVGDGVEKSMSPKKVFHEADPDLGRSKWCWVLKEGKSWPTAILFGVGAFVGTATFVNGVIS